MCEKNQPLKFLSKDFFSNYFRCSSNPTRVSSASGNKDNHKNQGNARTKTDYHIGSLVAKLSRTSTSSIDRPCIGKGKAEEAEVALDAHCNVDSP